jgi:hypothetical protein
VASSSIVATGRRFNLYDSGSREAGIDLTTPPDVASLRTSVRLCGAVLRQHKSTFGSTGSHLPRGVVEEIVAWARGTSDEKNAAVLLDSAGMGKTVVMRDVLGALEAANFTVLAIAADQQLSGVATHEDLREALGLPDRVETVVSRLAALGPVVVLVDQLDSLSLSLARDQKALNVVLGTVARLRLIPNVLVLFSCRIFDLNNNPRLKRIEVDRRFAPPKLTDEEVAGVLREEGVDFGTLSPATRELLRVPLHLGPLPAGLGRAALLARGAKHGRDQIPAGSVRPVMARGDTRASPRKPASTRTRAGLALDDRLHEP